MAIWLLFRDTICEVIITCSCSKVSACNSSVVNTPIWDVNNATIPVVVKPDIASGLIADIWSVNKLIIVLVVIVCNCNKESPFIWLVSKDDVWYVLNDKICPLVIDCICDDKINDILVDVKFEIGIIACI
jgi:hypothetical protein